jgi:citrate synthase
MLQDPDTKISRPRQVYSGEEVRDFVPIADRGVKQLVNA